MIQQPSQHTNNKISGSLKPCVASHAELDARNLSKPMFQPEAESNQFTKSKYYCNGHDTARANTQPHIPPFHAVSHSF